MGKAQLASRSSGWIAQQATGVRGTADLEIPWDHGTFRIGTGSLVKGGVTRKLVRGKEIVLTHTRTRYELDQ